MRASRFEPQEVDERVLSRLVREDISLRPAARRLQERLASYEDQYEGCTPCYTLGYGLILTKSGIREGYLGGGGWSYSFNAPIGYGRYKLNGTVDQVVDAVGRRLDTIDQYPNNQMLQSAGTPIANTFAKKIRSFLRRLSEKFIG